MVDIEIVEQKPVTMVELKSKLDAIKKNKNELNFRADKVYVYLEEFTSGRKSSEDLFKKLSGLGIQKLRDRHIAKIVDLVPEDLDSLKAIFAGESVTFKPDELKQILEAVNG